MHSTDTIDRKMSLGLSLNLFRCSKLLLLVSPSGSDIRYSSDYPTDNSYSREVKHGQSNQANYRVEEDIQKWTCLAQFKSLLISS